MLSFQIRTFPSHCHVAHIPKQDLSAFEFIALDRINGGSHITQLIAQGQTLGLTTLQVYPEHADIYISGIEVIRNARGNGLNKALLGGVFEYASGLSHEINTQTYISVGGFTEKGMRSVLPSLRELSIEYSKRGVTFDYRP